MGRGTNPLRSLTRWRGLVPCKSVIGNDGLGGKIKRAFDGCCGKYRFVHSEFARWLLAEIHPSVQVALEFLFITVYVPPYDIHKSVKDVTPFGFDNPGFMELQVGSLALNLLSVP